MGPPCSRRTTRAFGPTCRICSMPALGWRSLESTVKRPSPSSDATSPTTEALHPPLPLRDSGRLRRLASRGCTAYESDTSSKCDAKRRAGKSAEKKRVLQPRQRSRARDLVDFQRVRSHVAAVAIEKCGDPRLRQVCGQRRIIVPLLEDVHDADRGILNEQRIMMTAFFRFHLGEHGSDIAPKILKDVRI